MGYWKVPALPRCVATLKPWERVKAASSPHDRKPWLDAKLIRKSHMKWKAGSWASRNSKVNQMHHLEWKRKRGLLNPLSFFPCKSLFSFLCQLSCLCCSRWFRRPNTLESSQKLWVVMRFTEATNLVIKPFWSHAMPASKNLYFLLLYKKVSVIITQRETKVTWGFLFRCRLRPSKATADFFVVVEVKKKRKTRFTFSDSWLEYICYRVKEK